MRRTSDSSEPKFRASGASAAKAGAKPSSLATLQPTVANSIPRPTSARNSRRVNGAFIFSSECGRSRGPYLPVRLDAALVKLELITHEKLQEPRSKLQRSSKLKLQILDGRACVWCLMLDVAASRR